MNLQGILATTLPTLSVLVGILLNRNDVARLDARINNLQSQMVAEFAAQRSEMNRMSEEIGRVRDDLCKEIGAVRDDLHKEIGVIRDDLREFYRTQGQHEIRIDNLEKK